MTTHDFDYRTDPRLASDPHSVFDELYEKGPIFWSEALGGYWVLTRAEDIRAALQNPELFSNAHGTVPRPGGVRLLPLELDPPEHSKYRYPLAQPFSPNGVAEWEVPVRHQCNELLDKIEPLSTCDFVTDFAEPFPTRIFGKILGLPDDRIDEFVRQAKLLLHSYNSPEARDAAGARIADELRALIETRTAEPRDDVASRLIRSTVDDRPFTSDELLDTSFMLFIAGLDTVTGVLGFCFHYLAEHADVRARILTEPDRIKYHVDELLRVHAIVNATRTVAHDSVFLGQQLKAGDRILLSTPLACRDPEEFVDSNEVRLDREDRRGHMAFGAGVHRCLGSHLARLELQVAIEEWHRRIPEYRVVPGTEIRAHGGSVLGLEALPLQWPPAATHR